MPDLPSPEVRTLVYATSLDVLAPDRIVTRREGYWRVESPRNHGFWWGNLLLFDDPPVDGDRERWERLFELEFGSVPAIRHRTFAWDNPDGERGAAATEFPEPYELDESAGLIAGAGEIRPHPRANGEAVVRALDPAPGADAELWNAVHELQIAHLVTQGFAAEAELRDYQRRRTADLRRLFSSGGGSWYVALLDGEVAGSLGLVVTAGRARYQSVDTAERFRRRGVATRLVAQAARLAAAEHRIDSYVIVADPGYHAIGIYESVGFKRTELACGVCRPPGP